VEAQVRARERVLQAAIAIVEAEGEAPLRVDRVADMAGNTKPVTYHHFGDREGLIIAVQIERPVAELARPESNVNGES
jgi:AcrR family transcriptional regulator